MAKKTFTNFINNFKELQALPENNDPNIISSKKLSLEALNKLQTDIFIEINNIGLTYMHVKILHFVLDKLISALNILCNTNNASQYNNQIKLISNILTSCTNITRHLFQYKDIKKQY